MREPIPVGIYDTLWNWVEASPSQKLPDHENQIVLYEKDEVRLERAIGLEAQRHQNFGARSVCAPQAYVGVLPQGRYWVSESRTFAVIAPDNKLIRDVSLQIEMPNVSHPVFQKPDLPPAEYISETVAVLSHTYDSNYYHWLVDVASRIHLLDRSGIPIEKYIINGEGVPAFQSETLALLGIPEHKIIRTKRGMHLKAKRLVVPSLEMYSLLPHIPTFPAKWAVQYLRSELASGGGAGKAEGYERIYISRGDAEFRKVTNESRVAELLEANGFKIIVPGRMSVAEQIRMFASADFIVSPHGAGLANLMFCRPGTRLLELYSPNYVNPLYWYISNQVGVRYYYLIGQGEQVPIESGFGDVGYRVEPISVDVNQLSEMVRVMTRE